MHCPVEGVRSGQRVFLPDQEVPANRKSGVSIGKDVEWRVQDRWDDANNWLLEGRTVLIFKGGDRKDTENYRPITCLPTITKMVTLAIHKRMPRFPFGNGERSILELDRRGVRTSQGCKEGVIENLASNMTKKGKKETVELYYDFEKACDDGNHGFLERHIKVYGIPSETKC